MSVQVLDAEPAHIIRLADAGYGCNMKCLESHQEQIQHRYLSFSAPKRWNWIGDERTVQ